MKWVPYAISLVAGMALPVQIGINSELKRHVGGGMQATLVSFAVGTVAALVYCITMRNPLPSFQQAAAVPAWGWLGGVFGVFYVWTTIFAAPRLGAATVLSLVVAGQLLAALVLDHFGALGLPLHAITPSRVVGILLVIAGVGIYLRS